MSVFYDHLVGLEEVNQALQQYIPDEAERESILQLVDQTVHHTVLETIFSLLPHNQHEVFLLRFKEDPASHTHLSYLRQFSPEAEHHIRAAIHQSHQTFIDAIHGA